VARYALRLPVELLHAASTACCISGRERQAIIQNVCMLHASLSLHTTVLVPQAALVGHMHCLPLLGSCFGAIIVAALLC
jgi:hypothetical protein